MPFLTNPGSSTPTQIDRGSFTIEQQGNTVGYVYSEIDTEYWVLRTASPAYTWPHGPTGTTTTCSYSFVSDQSFASLEDFVAWVESQTGWASSDYETVTCACTVSQPA